jgi:hypothetical protein
VTSNDVVALRLATQKITGSKPQTPYDVVKGLGAMQAQDYLGALWAIGLRTSGATEEDIKKAVASGTIARTWPQRGTLHFVAPEEVRWRLALTAPRIAQRFARPLADTGLDQKVLNKSKEAFHEALAGGKHLTRPQLMKVLEARGIDTKSQRGYHLLAYNAVQGHIILGRPEGKQQTFTLLDEWVPSAPDIPREEALARLVTGYFRSHGPATMHDLVFWSGLTVTDIKQGLETAKKELHSEIIDGVTYWMGRDAHPAPQGVHLLPPFDEYLLGYKDRTAALDLVHFPRVVPSANGMFSPIVVVGGKVLGTWKRQLKKDKVVLQVIPFGKFTASQKKSIVEAADEYGKFLGLTTEVEVL